MTLPVRRSADQTYRWNPLRDFEDFYQQVDRLARSALGTGPDARTWLPAGDVVETDDGYLVEVELAGVRREDVDIELYGDELVITGEAKERERKGLFRRRTRRTGEFEYRVTLPGDIRADGIEASLDSGVLTVRVPKMNAANPKKITITGR